MAKARRKVVLVFGESNNDRTAVIEIAMAIRPDARVQFEKRDKPLVLTRNAKNNAKRRSPAEEIARLVVAANVTNEVIGVIAHRDCDAVEPAHEDMAEEIERELRKVGVPAPVAAAPAFEIEAWWLLFPAAVARVRPCWRRLPTQTLNVGSIGNAKEHLRRCLRPSDLQMRNRCPDYAESDSVAIARTIREMNLLQDEIVARCASLSQFRKKILALTI